MFSESGDPRQRPHVAWGITYRRAMRELAAFFDCEPTEAGVYDFRTRSDPAEYAARLLRATGTETLLVDDGYPPPGEGTSWDELGELAGCEAWPVLRIERLEPESVRDEVATARERGFAGLKTIAAYRGGLDLEAGPPAVRDRLLAALEANEATGDPLPLQVHCGFGDSDLHLPRAD